MQRLYVECECNTPEHRLVFTHYPKINDDDSELYLSYYLDIHMSFFDRVKTAIRYIFKMESFDDFGDTNISKESAKQIINILKDHVEG